MAVAMTGQKGRSGGNRGEVRITIRFPSLVVEAMRGYAEEDRRSLNAEIITALEQFIDARKAGGKAEGR